MSRSSAHTHLCAEQVVLVLELFQPGCGADLVLALWTAACASEKEGFFFDQLVVEGITVTLVVSCPVR